MKKKFVDLDSNNTAPIAMAAQSVRPNSTVLEFGCASGYLTRYLTEEKQCKVSICEVDADAAMEAAKYADNVVIGDCESMEWVDKYANQRYDYILFTDVLEHLRDPGAVLCNARPLLKSSGKVCASIPNISYKTVLIDLIQHDRFEYVRDGILDSSHLRFFTEKTAIALFEMNHFEVSKINHFKGPVTKKEKSMKEFPLLIRWYLSKVNKNIETAVFYIEAVPNSVSSVNKD